MPYHAPAAPTLCDEANTGCYGGSKPESQSAKHAVVISRATECRSRLSWRTKLEARSLGVDLTSDAPFP